MADILSYSEKRQLLADQSWIPRIEKIWENIWQNQTCALEAKTTPEINDKLGPISKNTITDGGVALPTLLQTIVMVSSNFKSKNF